MSSVSPVREHVTRYALLSIGPTETLTIDAAGRVRRGRGPGLDMAGVVVVDDSHGAHGIGLGLGALSVAHIAWGSTMSSGAFFEREGIGHRLIAQGCAGAQPAKHRPRSTPRCADRFTGLSGSGKSSLVFDTIFAEGQRRYGSNRCRHTPGSSSARWTSPTSTSSKVFRPRCRSTRSPPTATRGRRVGTITEVYDYLRVLYARAGTPHCPVCGERIARQPRNRSSTRCWQSTRACGSRCSRRW